MPAFTEQKKEEKLKQAELDKQLAYEHFCSWVVNFDEKSFNLKTSKADIVYDFYNRFLNNEFQGIKEFTRAVLKSYVMAKDEEIKPFVSPEDFAIKKPVELINKFLNDFIINGKPVQCENSEDVYKALAKIIATNTEEIFGHMLYLNLLSPKSKSFGDTKKFLIEEFKNRKYLPYIKDDQRFLIKIRPISIVENNQNQQRILLETYISAVNIFIDGYRGHFSEAVKKDKFNKFWDAVGFFLSNVERKLSEENKISEDFVQAKKNVENFYGTTKEILRRSKTAEGRNGVYYNLVKESLRNFLDGKASDEEKNALNAFCNKVKVLNKALKITDEKGQNYPVNYFACMPIHPATMLSLLTRMQNSGILSDELARIFGETKSLTRASFTTTKDNFPVFGNTGDVTSIEETLRSFKGQEQVVNGYVCDLSDENQYDMFVEKVEKVVDKNSLPKNQLCITYIGKDIIRGREPINLRDIDLQKENKNAEKSI